ncbi:LPXTG cell wall anchor domain-containing protein [Actinoplanes sp. Pm04-4]|uniref:LPXTG cell wall anchor domain-containing protein n=1 Tax=Paractinoplanes pyxinae TaxID=2997416 RepID=A0ABT4BCV9_9ACTN|nr:LPXTG cell wall anchor domain-containing protein [Actinoplanes pyxinae]MCY1143415.1 LPXTG cell wall anchor domain-containing protein [Actinoplanes pyxinae]
MVLRRLTTLAAALSLGALAAPALSAPALAAAALAAPVELNISVDAPAEVVEGQVAFVGVTAFANSSVDPASVRIAVTLPEGVTFLSAGQPSAGACEADGAIVTCDVTDPGAIERRQYGYQLRLQFDAPTGTSLPISATITSDGEEQTPADNTSTATTKVVDGLDLGLKVEKISGPTGPANVVTYTYVIRNNGRFPTGVIQFNELSEPRAFGTGDFEPPSAGCISEVSPLIECAVDVKLAPGREFRVTRKAAVPADSPVWGHVVKVQARVFDQPRGGGEADNDEVAFEIDFTGGPATPAPSASPTPTGGTAAPTPTGGGTAAPAPGEGGGLPITGAPTVAVALTGLGLLVAGAGALLAARRRKI